MSSPETLHLHVFASLQELGEAAAEYVADVSAAAVAAHGRFTVAFSGGSLPKILCPPLAQLPVGWPAWHVFFADERYVPPDHPESNYQLVREQLFEHVAIPESQIYQLDHTLPLEQAAQTYQHTMSRVFNLKPPRVPAFDLILLGMGEDGHTASLFPGHALLAETTRWVAPVSNSPKPPPERITLTLPVINQARHVAFITAGAGKSRALQQVITDTASDQILPAQRVQPAGQLHWFVDQPAATGLTT